MAWEWDSRYTSPYVPFGAPRYSSSLTLADLYQPPPPRPAYPAAPTIPSSFGELGDQAKKDLRREAILRFAQALAAPGGRIGEGLAAAAGGLSDWKAQQVEQARANMERDYVAGVKRADLESARAAEQEQEEQRRLHAEGRLSLVQAIADREPDLASQAEAAARSGDEVLLRETAKEADRRARARAAGQDPNDPFADERTKAQIATDEFIRRQEELKKRGLSAYFDEPGLSIEEIEARAAAAARGQRSVWGDRSGGGEGGGDALNLRTSNGIVGEVVEENGRRVWKPLLGQESRGSGEWRTWVDPDTQKQVRINDATGEKRPVDDQPPRPASQVLIDIEATLGRKLTAEERADARADYLRGKRPRDIVSGLRAPKRITAPATAPTQGQAPKPKPGPKSGPPPREVRQREGTKPKLNERTKEELRRQAKSRWDSLPEEQKKRWGGFEKYFNAALQAW
jgi:hypothetical protein